MHVPQDHTDFFASSTMSPAEQQGARNAIDLCRNLSKAWKSMWKAAAKEYEITYASCVSPVVRGMLNCLGDMLVLILTPMQVWGRAQTCINC